MMKDNAPFLTPNPQDFKLRIVWSADGSTKIVAELSNCKWLPRIGETLVLPIDEKRQSSFWQKFKVFDIIYDFRNQIARVLCSPVKSLTPPSAKTLIEELKKPKDKWDVWERLEYKLSQMDEKDIDDDIEVLKAELLNPTAVPKPIKNEKYADVDLESLRKELDEL
ncbi:MAG: hypothetical protein V7K21_19315 [Nostoc sp.]|uniref:hypothetical protein n=1 Tax=Nostoc sp. TaxID=1180 RepID=UPI002FFC6A42